jgi:prophage tail gpP-like protein
MSNGQVFVTVTGYRNGRKEETFFPHWQRVYIRKSLDEICQYAEFEAGEADAPNIKKHDKVTIHYGTEKWKPLVTTVYVETKKRVLNNQKFSYLFTCRSAARDIIDSQWSGRIRNALFSDIVYQIASPFGIPVIVFSVDERGRPVKVDPKAMTNNPTSLVAEFEWENESPWPRLLQEADNQGVLLTSSETGGLYIWKVASSERTEGFSLEQDRNIEEFEEEEDGTQQFQTYEFKGEVKLARGRQTRIVSLTDDTCPNY